MPRRLASLLLTMLIALAGVGVGACPQGRCAAMQAAAHDCCKRDGLTRPSCCPATEHLSQQQAPPALERAADGIQFAAAQAVPVVLAAPAPHLPEAPRDIDPGAAPPGTLIAQHTSLLL